MLKRDFQSVENTDEVKRGQPSRDAYCFEQPKRQTKMWRLMSVETLVVKQELCIVVGDSAHHRVSVRWNNLSTKNWYQTEAF